MGLLRFLASLALMVLVVLPQGGAAAAGPFSNTRRIVQRLGRRIAPHAIYIVSSSEAIIAASHQLKLKLAYIIGTIELETKLLETLELDDGNLLEKIPAVTTVLAGINLLVFGLWQISCTLPSNSWYNFMDRHFILSGDGRLRHQLPHSYVTSGFSHRTKDHIAGNLLALFQFCQKTEQALGARKFVYMYIMSIYAANRIGSVSLDKNLGGSLGASGAISAVQAYFCLRFPKHTFKIGPYNLRAPWACLVWFLQDLRQLGRHDTKIGHGAHLGGHMFGALFFLGNNIFAPKMTEYFNKQARWNLPIRLRPYSFSLVIDGETAWGRRSC